MSKPERKRPGSASTLAPNVEAIMISGHEPAQPVAPAAKEPANVDTPAKGASKKAVTIRLELELIGEAQAAVLATQSQAGGYDSFNALVAAGIAAEIQRAAEQFNGGTPFPPIAGNFRRGRPLQSN